jgi:hypothetical protein
VANYNVDIELAVKGLDKTKALKSDIQAITKAVNDYNKALKTGKIGNPFDVTGARKAQATIITGQQRINKLQQEYNRLITPVRRPGGFAIAANELPQQKELLTLVRRRQQVIERIKKQRLDMAGVQASLQRLEKRSVVAIKDAQREQKQLNQEKKKALEIEKATATAARTAAETNSKRRSAAVTAGAFPLLFGGGPFQALGGAAGGLATGNMFGGATVALQVVGGALDQAVNAFINQTNALAASLKDPTEALGALEQAGYRVSQATKDSVEELIEAGKAYEAHLLVLEEINNTLGPGAVGQLQAYRFETEKLQDNYNNLKVALEAELLPAVVGTISVINELAGAFTDFYESPIGQFAQGVTQQIANMFIPGSGMVSSVFGAFRERGRTLGNAAAAPSLDRGLAESDRLKALDKEEEQRAIMRKAEKKHQQEMKRLESERAAAQRKASQDRLQAVLAEIDLQQRIISLEQLKRQQENDALQQQQDLETSISLLTIEQMRIHDELNSLGLDEISKLDITREQINGIFEIEKALLIERQEQEIMQAKSIKNLDLINNKYLYLLGNLEDQKDLMLALNDIEQNRALLDEGFTQETLEEMFSVEQNIDKLIEKYPLLGQAADAAANMMTFGIQSFVDGTKTAEEVFADFLRSIADMLMRTAQQMIAQYIVLGVARAFGLGGGIPSFQSGMNAGLPSFGDYGGMNLAGNFGGFRADGGSVSSGRSYLVGERGPELFVPGAQGNIVPNNAMGGVNVGTINISVENTGDQLNPKAQKQIAGQVQSIVLSTLANERRSGGML